MYTYKTIIFDLDGTLFKTDTIFIDAIHHTCISRGMEPIDKERLLKLIGKPSSTICRELFGENLSENEVQSIRAELRTYEDKLIAKSSQLYEGVKTMLSNLKNEGYTLGLCTNGSREYMNKILSHFDIAEYFQIKKSRVEGLEKSQIIKQILDECASCSAIIVGDTSIDFDAADAARCLSVGVSYGYGGDDYKNSDFIADNPADIFMIIRKINGIYKEIAGDILNRKQKNKPLIVGINGVDTSGKSTFTKELARYLFKIGFKSHTISIDDFHNPSKIRNKEKNPVTSYLNNAFDITKIENEIMKSLVTDKNLDKELLLLNLETDEFTNNKRYVIDEDTIVLFEGVLLYREPLNQYFDFRIFIDISLKRAAKRDLSLLGKDVIEKYNNKYIPIQKLYIEKYNPKNLSDIIIDNNDYWNPKILKHPNSIPIPKL
ncbi:HAD hydrolase-like protein [Clostridium sp.]|uniref:HAD hydrolase-like protein n=1 Tax=Clostridium sp. TaxID=1506 RepID=UPI003217121D